MVQTKSAIIVAVGVEQITTKFRRPGDRLFTMPNRFHPDDDIESAANIAMNGPQLSSSPATGAISRGMPSSVHSTWEDYPIQEATEIGLSVRKHDPPVFSVHRADGTRLFADRDFERVRAYLMGFRDGMES